MYLIDQHADLLNACLDDVRRITLQLDTLIQQADTPVVELTLEGNITYLNPAATQWLGVNQTAAQGRAFTDFVADSTITQRHLELFAHSGPPQMWPERLLNDPNPYPLVARRIERPNVGTRLLLWVDASTSAAAPADADQRCLSDYRRVCGADLERVRERLDLNVQRICEVLGITSTTWYSWRKAEHTPIPNRTAELHLRLLDALPEIAQVRGHPDELKQVLVMRFGIHAKPADVARWLGTQTRRAYVWADKGLISGQVRGLTRSLLRVLFEQPPRVWRLYLNIVEQQQRLEKHAPTDKH